MSAKKEFVSRLCEILVEQGAIEEGDSASLQESFANFAQPQFDFFLLDQGIVDRPRLLKALSTYYQVPAFDVVGYFFKRELLRKFPKGVLLRNVMIPLEVDQNMLLVVANEPDNQDLLVRIGESVSYDVRFCVGIRRDIIDAIEQYYDRSPSAQDRQELLSEPDYDTDSVK